MTGEPFYVFVTGGAGVGKSHLIKAVYHTMVRSLRQAGQNPDELLAILSAPTGTAAYNIGGMTLHSTFFLPCKKANYQNDNLNKLSQEKRNTLRCKLQAVKLLIIDEVSMVSAQTLHDIHLRLQEIMGVTNPHVYFGGLSVLAVGDLLQLPPVGGSQVFSVQTNSLARLHGSLWQRLFSVVELSVIYRQQGDPTFAQTLNRIRTGEHTEEDMELLSSRSMTTANPAPASALHIFPLRRQVENHNIVMLSSMPAEPITISAHDSQKDRETGLLSLSMSDDIHQTGGLHKELPLKISCRVSLTRNIDVSDGLVNGAQGTVVNIALPTQKPLTGTIFIKFDKADVGSTAISSLSASMRQQGAVPVQAETASFEIGNYAAVHVSRTQFPLTLSWAATIHKVQGTSLDTVVVNFSEAKNLQCGQAYVALGRSKTLSGLYLHGLNGSKIHANRKALVEMKRLHESCQLNWLPPTMTETAQSCIKVVHLNCRSLRSHWLHIENDQKLMAADVLCLTETHLVSNTNAANYLRGFIVVYKNEGRGIAIALRDGIGSTELGRMTAPELEYVSLQILGTSPVIITTVYRPPLATLTQYGFFLPLNSVLCNSEMNEMPSVVLGDFNIDLEAPQHTALSDFMAKHGYCQMITQPTHNLGSVLDHVYFSATLIGKPVGVMPCSFSDHSAVYALL